MKKIGVAAVGVGVRGFADAKLCAENPNVVLEAVVDLNVERAEQARQELGAKKAYKTIDEMLKNQSVDAVIIATPDHMHLEPALKAIEASKHILIEKPMATSVKDAQAILSAAEKAHVKLMVCFENRFELPIMRIKKAIEDNELGKIFYIYQDLSNNITSPTRMLKWAGESNVANFLMSHTLDLSRHFFESEFTDVMAYRHSGVLEKLGVPTPDEYAATIRFSDGGIANLHSSWILPKTVPLFVQSVEIIGTDGYLTLRWTERENPLLHIYSDSTQVIEFGNLREHTVDYFIDCIRTDQKVKPDGKDGLAVTKALCAIVESAEKETTVRI